MKPLTFAIVAAAAAVVHVQARRLRTTRRENRRIYRKLLDAGRALHQRDLLISELAAENTVIRAENVRHLELAVGRTS